MTAHSPKLATSTRSFCTAAASGMTRRLPPPPSRSISRPSFDFPDTATAIKIVNFEQIAYTYSRVGNPTVDAFEQRLAALEAARQRLGWPPGRPRPRSPS